METDYQKFALRGAPTEWLDYGNELFEAAENLYLDGKETFSISANNKAAPIKRPGHSRVTIFLFALSIENLLKGILVAENPQYISNGVLSKEVTGGFHGLVVLNKKIKSSPLKRADMRLLKILEGSIPSWGRYPIPKNYRDTVLEHIIKDKFRERVKNIFEALEKHLYEKIRLGWKGPHRVTLKSAFNSKFEGKP